MYTENDDLYFQEITYSGIDISRIEYASDCQTGIFRNDYIYDGDHRIKQQINTIFGDQQISDAYSTSYTYDLAGNILSLNRNGWIDLQSSIPIFGAIDQLAYDLPGQHLLNVTDGITDPTAQPKGFVPQSSDFTYALRRKHYKVKNPKQIKASAICNWVKIFNLREAQYRAGQNINT